LGEPAFDLELLGSTATAICAAVVAFALAVPGRSRLWALLPLPPLAVWIGSVGGQCLTHWVSYDAAGMAMGDTARCFATVVLTSLPLWLLMLRRSGSFSRALSMLAGNLAVAAAAGCAMDLLHRLDASVMILLWNFGTGASIVLLSTIIGRPLLSRNASLSR
jgi:hypothetical protein